MTANYCGVAAAAVLFEMGVQEDWVVVEPK